MTDQILNEAVATDTEIGGQTSITVGGRDAAVGTCARSGAATASILLLGAASATDQVWDSLPGFFLDIMGDVI